MFEACKYTKDSVHTKYEADVAMTKDKSGVFDYGETPQIVKSKDLNWVIIPDTTIGGSNCKYIGQVLAGR